MNRIGYHLNNYRIVNNLTNISIIFTVIISVFSINIIPGTAGALIYQHNNTTGNDDCNNCHIDQYAEPFPPKQIPIINKPIDSPQINNLNPVSVTQSNSQAFAATNVAGNITLIARVGQDWFQQGIYGPSSSVSPDQSWGWTFFDENPPSGFIVPSDNITQKNNIYALLLDDGNNSNLISGANVVANVTYWIYNGTSYVSNIISVQLTEDITRRGSYNGIFLFYGGTKYYKYGMNNCDGCHPTAYHALFQDNLTGYFPGNYTVSIKAEADNKIKTIDTKFEVTPWGCEDCHGSGNQHHYSGSIDSDSACYVCHGVTQIGYHSAYKAGNPHQNTAHRDIQCTDCHTNKSINSLTFNGVTFVDEKPQYDYDVVQLNSGTHSNLTCRDCHRDLTLSVPQGDYKSDNYTINNIINRYDLSFTSLQQFQDNYVVNVTQGEPLNISFDWEGTSNLGFYLYPPNFNPRNLTGRPYNNGANNSKPETYINATPMPGKWILSPYGYNLGTRSGMVNLFGTLQSPINYTINSTYPIENKNLPSLPECNECHNSSALGGAYTKYVIPDWNPGFGHVDTNKDGNLDIQCRMCHDSMHNITIKKCQTCHTSAPTNHPISEPSFSLYTRIQCLACHGDPHKVTMAGGGCTGCHSSPGTRYYVNTSLFAGHANLNTSDGANNVTDADCMTCHYRSSDIIMSPDAGLGAANHSNTWFCDDCHTTGGSSPIKPINPALMKDGTNHGSADCKWCHIAGDPLPRPLDSTMRFHPNGPKGTASGKDCLSCHYYSNLPDLPFHAPGEGHSSDIGECSEGCHEQTDNHRVNPLNSNTPPTISGLTATSPVFAGSPVQVQAMVNEDQTQIAAAQYQIKKGSTIVKDWTDMTPKDGRFNSLSELVNASIDTSKLLGTYTVNVKGMASAPKSGGGPYYPLNGQWSGVYTTQFVVKQAEGYDNGMVYGSLGVKLAGAIVSTDTGISTTTNGTGFYSLSLANGTYHLTASKEPEYYVNNSVVVTVTALTTITQDITLTLKPMGMISGKVTYK